MSPAADTVVHTYGIVPSTDVPLPETGIDGSPVGTIALEGVAVVVSRLHAGRFGAAAWEAHGQDPRWLEPVARQHHEVLQALCETDPAVDVVPLRLPGIYPDDEAVRHALLNQLAGLRQVLDEIRGHSEWGVKVFLAGQPRPAEESAPTSGRDYLMRKSDAAADRERTRQRRQQLLLDVYEGLTRAATHSVVNPPQDEALSGRKEPMLLNSAHLVPQVGEEGFFDMVEALSHQIAPEGMLVEVSGPWPPYNFAHVVEASEAS
jgi:hypothetical protein